MENGHGMLTDFQVTEATGTAERDAVPVLVDQARERGFYPKTMGGDENYDTQDCVAGLRERGPDPIGVAQNTAGRRSAIDGRTTRHSGYALSQRARKRVEEIFRWMKPLLSKAEVTVGWADFAGPGTVAWSGPAWRVTW